MIPGLIFIGFALIFWGSCVIIFVNFTLGLQGHHQLLLVNNEFLVVLV